MEEPLSALSLEVYLSPMPALAVYFLTYLFLLALLKGRMAYY
jgi:hypothetical protein